MSTSGARAFAQGRELLAQGTDHAARRVEVDPLAETRHVQRRRLRVEEENVRLQAGEAAFAHFAPEGDQAVQVVERGRTHRFGTVQAVGAAVRPVKTYALSRVGPPNSA